MNKYREYPYILIVKGTVTVKDIGDKSDDIARTKALKELRLCADDIELNDYKVIYNEYE